MLQCLLMIYLWTFHVLPFIFYLYVDLNQVIRPIEFDADESKAVKDRLVSLYNGTHSIKVLDCVILTTFKNWFMDLFFVYWKCFQKYI